jgi:hypothetical protein
MTPRHHRAAAPASTAAATFDAEQFLERFWRMDAQLAAAGFAPISPWWREQTERFIRALVAAPQGKPANWPDKSPTLRRLVIRAGRRAGKSSTLARLAVAWAWFGPWHVPLGDIGVVAFVSVSKDEAGARLRTIGTILETLGLEHDPRTDEVELLEGRPVLFKVFAATTRAAVGFTAILVIGDEAARWESRDTAANPAGEVFGSLAPTLATQRYGFTVACSSPWGADDWHAQRFDEGDTDHQLVSFAPTWVANPTISEEQTHAFEPDDRVWSREYAAEPGQTVSAAFDTADVDACFGRTWSGLTSGPGFVATDPSSLRGDAYTYLCGRETDASELVVREVGGWSGDAQRKTAMADIVAAIAARARKWETRIVYADQREEAALRALFAQQHVAYESFAWTEASKDEAVMLLRRLMRERRVYLPEHAELKRELVAMKARMMPSGRIRYDSNGLDYASALITLAHAIVAKKVLTGAHGARSAPLPRRPNLNSPFPNGYRTWKDLWGERPPHRR